MPFGLRGAKRVNDLFCYRRVLQQQVKRSIAVGYAVWVAKAKRINDLFCYRRVLQQQVKRSIAVGYAVWGANSKTSQ